MRPSLQPCFGLAVLALASVPAHAMLQSTSFDGYSGNVGMVYSKVKVTVGPQWLDIEEEAELTAEPVDGGTGPWFVDGTFDVPTGTVVTGCLLWNDDTLLMGKLRGKAIAGKSYDSTVSTSPSGYAHDPLLVDQTGDSTYRLRLYPIADGGNRRIRIRYLVPVTSTSGVTSILPVLYQALSGTAPQSWTLDVRGTASNLRIYHDNAWFPLSPPTERVLSFATGGQVQLDWTTLAADGSRAIRDRIDSGAWKGDFVLFTGKVPDSIGNILGIRSETVFLWRWISPQSFFSSDYYGNRSINSYGQQAISQAQTIVGLSSQLAGMGNKVGLVADAGLGDTTEVFPLSDTAGASYRQMNTWLNGIDVNYLNWRIPAPATYAASQGNLDIANNRQYFRTDIQYAGALYSKDSGVVRQLVIVTVGPVPSGGDLQEEPDLSPLPPSVSVSSSQLLESTGWNYTYDAYGNYLGYGYTTIPPTLSQWPGIDLQGVAAARPAGGNIDSLNGVPLPKIRKTVAATLTLTSSQGSIQQDVVIQRGPDGSWTAGINAQALGIGQQVNWSFFDDTAKLIASWSETPAWTSLAGDSLMPRLWAASSSHISPNFSTTTSLAPIFGIVDRQYSLLALPSDSLGLSRQASYADSGVPFLSTRDIFAQTGYGENTGTAIRAVASAGTGLSVRLLAGLHQVRIGFTGLNPISIEIRDLRGHKVADWSQEALVGKTSVVWMGRNSLGGTVPSGVYVVRLRTATQVVSASVALP
jgi:hypothetical protein